jgi:uncharacterized SAM-binding protein YcdF (DUF218 family)
MGYVLSKVIGALLTPGMILLIGLAAGIVLLWRRRRWRRGRALLSLLFLGFLICVATPLQPWLTEGLEDSFPADPPLPGRIDGIVILGGAIDPALSLIRQRVTVTDAAERLIAGAVLAKAHPEAIVLYSGGSADPLRPEATEAPQAAALLAALGVAADRLRIEDKSRNTYENVLFSQRLVAPAAGQSWVLITSARHMPRAIGIFRRLKWPVIAYPVDFQSGGGLEWANVDLPLQRLRLLAQALHEWLGLAYYRLNGWTDTLFPRPDGQDSRQ